VKEFPVKKMVLPFAAVEALWICPPKWSHEVKEFQAGKILFDEFG